MSGILKFHNKNAKNITRKVLVIHGDQDRLIHCDRGYVPMRDLFHCWRCIITRIALANEIPNVRLVVLKACGHNFWWTHQEITLNHLFAFLNCDSSL
jgi:pimeloyl-ACP methyl ester carboxylesterase